MEKICNVCKLEKNQDEFYHGLAHCKLCRLDRIRQYQADNKEAVAAYQRKWYLENRESEIVGSKKWIKDNKEQHKKNKHRRSAERKEEDPLYRLKDSIRCLIGISLRKGGYTKKSRTYQILGCSYEDLMKHLGPKPEGVVHLDHICPCAQAKTEDEIVALQHYTNFRWLLAHDNLAKCDSITPDGEQLCKQLLKREWIND